MNTQIWAHRGFCARYRENTMRAFAAAVAVDADGIELDVQTTKDGKIVVVHDEFLNRLCGVPGHVAAIDYADLPALLPFDRDKESLMFRLGGDPQADAIEAKLADKLAALDESVAAYDDTRIPLLTEVLELIEPSRLIINIELKNSIDLQPGLEEKVRAEVAAAGMTDRVCYSSFNHAGMNRMAAEHPDCGILFQDILYRPAVYAGTVGVKALHPMINSLQDRSFIEAAKAAGLKIHAWTVDRVEHLQLAFAAGIDAVITDVPHIAQAVRDAVAEAAQS